MLLVLNRISEDFHNIGFYEEMAKIIKTATIVFQLSSNIIKYALYLFSYVLLCFGLSIFKIL